MIPEHMPLRVRKGVLARLIVHESVQPVLEENTQKDVEAVVQAALRTIDSETEKELDASSDETPLDEFVRGAVEKVARDIEEDRRTRKNPQLADSASAMRARIAPASLSCERCADTEPPCEGDQSSRRDDAILDRAGHCIARFRDLFEVALEIARRHHELALGPAALERWPVTRFGTAFKTKAHPFASPAQITGATHVRDDGALVELIFAPASFNWPSYLAATYVLVHEAFHVMEGSESAYDREPREDDDRFVEAWMDWIAFHSFDDTTQNRGPAADLHGRIPYSAAQRDRARQLHEARYDAYTSENKFLSRCLKSGENAARRFFEFCRSLIPSSATAPEAWRAMLKISLLINLRGLSFDDHDRLISRVRRYLPEIDEPMTLELLTPELEELAKAIRTGDAAAAVAWLLG